MAYANTLFIQIRIYQLQPHAKNRMATSVIEKDLIFKEVPYSDFTWESSNKQFSATLPSYDQTKYAVVGILVTPNNGTALMDGYINYGAGAIRVCGWVPYTGTSVAGNYTFTCYLVLRKISS